MHNETLTDILDLTRNIIFKNSYQIDLTHEQIKSYNHVVDIFSKSDEPYAIQIANNYKIYEDSSSKFEKNSRIILSLNEISYMRFILSHNIEVEDIHTSVKKKFDEIEDEILSEFILFLKVLKSFESDEKRIQCFVDFIGNPDNFIDFFPKTQIISWFGYRLFEIDDFLPTIVIQLLNLLPEFYSNFEKRYEAISYLNKILNYIDELEELFNLSIYEN